MNQEVTKALAVKFFEHLTRGDTASAWSMATEDVKWIVNRHDIRTGLRVTMNRTQFERMFADTEWVFREPPRMEISALMSGDGRAAIEARGQAVAKDGTPYNDHFVFTFGFRDDRISEVCEYLDTAYSEQALNYTPSAEQ